MGKGGKMAKKPEPKRKGLFAKDMRDIEAFNNKAGMLLSYVSIDRSNMQRFISKKRKRFSHCD